MTDEEKTEEAPTQPLGEPEAPGPRRFTRSRDDRMLAGVAGGLGRYFSVDPLIVRIGFAVSVFFGGLGVIAYAMLALFVPSDPAAPGGEPEAAPVQRSRWIGLAAIAAVVLIAIPAAGSLLFWADPWPWDGGGWGFGWGLFLIAVAVAVYALVTRRRDADGSLEPGRILAVAGIALLAVFGLSTLAVLSAWVGATGSGVVIGAVVAAIGAMLVIGAFVGGARWLIAPALALAIPLAAVSAADISFSGGVGERQYRPASTAAIPDDGYELGVGRLAVDLRDLDWHEREVVSLDVDLGIGEAVVAVPERVCVSADLRAGLGELEAAGDDSNGFDAERTIGDGATATPRLELDGDVDLGALRVVNDDDLDLDRGHWDRWHGDGDDGDEAARDAAERACSKLS